MIYHGTQGLVNATVTFLMKDSPKIINDEVIEKIILDTIVRCRDDETSICSSSQFNYRGQKYFFVVFYLLSSKNMKKEDGKLFIRAVNANIDSDAYDIKVEAERIESPSPEPLKFIIQKPIGNKICGLNNFTDGVINGCFMNSVMQALFNSSIFTNEIKKYKNINPNSITEIVKQSLVDYNTGVSNKGKSITLNKLYQKTINGILIEAKQGQQQDAGEFYNNLIGKLHEENKIMAKTNVLSGHQQMTTYCICANGEPETRPPILESFYCIFLSIKTKDNKLEQLLSNYTAPVEISKKDFFRSCCNNEIASQEQQTKLVELPQLLVLILKIYDNNRNKIDNSTIYPATLKINVLEKSEGKINAKYNAVGIEKFKLIAVTRHSGESIRSGHYTSHCNKNGKWYYVDDNKVIESNEKDALTAKYFRSANAILGDDAYMLFYEKIVPIN